MEGNQASINGGAIDFTKELDAHLASLRRFAQHLLPHHLLLSHRRLLQQQFVGRHLIYLP